jgi:CubicO group peptidase (beta-lactamase class C family)
MLLTKREFLLTSAGALAAWCLPRCATTRPRAPRRNFSAIHDRFAALVQQGALPGAVWLTAQGNDVTADAVGVSTIGGRMPMRRDTIFRIASMTKPITAAGVMMLVEEGRLELNVPAERWLPELANRRVLKRLDGPLDETVPAVRPITVRDLMTFTLGFGILFDPTPPIQRTVEELQLAMGPPVPMTPHSPDEWMRRFGTLPLMHQPGEKWMYNTGSLLQGVLVARVAGRSLDSFLRERIFEPLGMKDTGFHVPSEKLDRFAGCGYFTDPNGKKLQMDRDGAESAYSAPPVFPSGAGGLVSTADDFLAFARVLLNGGAHHGKRILSERSVREMTTDHLTPSQKAASSFFPGFFDTNGWGYGLSVSTAPDAISQTPSRYGWFGGFGTAWINDPKHGLVGVILTQSPDFLFSGALESVWRAVYQALG